MNKGTFFYASYYHYFILGLVLIILIAITLVSFILYEIQSRPLPTFYAKDPSGKTMELTPFTEPNLLPDTLLKWASKAATASYTFDYSNYQNQINEVRPYFTSAGFQDYLNSVQGLINSIVKNQLFVNGVVSGTPVIANEGNLPGLGYSWRIQIPFLVTYQSANTTVKKNFYVILTVVRVPTHVNVQGIGIDQFVMV